MEFEQRIPVVTRRFQLFREVQVLNVLSAYAVGIKWPDTSIHLFMLGNGAYRYYKTYEQFKEAELETGVTFKWID